MFKQIVKNSWIPVVFADLEGVIQFTNSAADALYGYAEGELIGKKVPGLNADERFPPKIIIEEVNKIGGWSGEILQRKKDGTIFYGKLTLCLISDENGNPIGYASNSNDLSESKNTERELTCDKARLKAIIDNTEDHILSLDPDFKIVEFNQSLAKQVKLRYNFDLTAGVNVFSILPDGSEERLREIYVRVLNGEKILKLEEFVLADGRKIYYENSYHPITEGNKITGIAIFSRHTSERHKKEKLLESTLKEREVLLAEIHHRVKNNLAVVSGFLTLEEFNAKNSEVKEILKESKMRIKATALVHELLYKNESLADINLKVYINDLVKLISNSYNFPAREIEIHCNIIEKKLNLEGALSCGLILNELISNAYKHAFTGRNKGEIFIDLNGDEKQCMLTVTDNGGGFPKNFDLEKSTSTGMMLIKTFAEQMNGTVQIEQETGTTFKMTFALEEKNINS